MNTTPITDRIESACEATAPQSKERTKALKAIRWVLMCAAGYAALAPDTRCVLVEDIASAQVFTGMDNDALKAAFWSAQLGETVTPMLLP